VSTVNPDSSVYYHSGYWNDLAAVRDHIGALATGDAGLPWYLHLLQWRGRPFRKALFLNCGNGWVERDLINAGVVLDGVGIDYSDDLLESARTEAEKNHLPLRYYQMDTNTAEFPEGDYDLVVLCRPAPPGLSGSGAPESVFDPP
jgi:2-polyprenyl-3-methyl-5-hydroxy-6-metoxy-1,4-benzoquinol methylase